MRLDKFLRDCGKGSRKDIKKVLKNGSVCVNGTVVKSADFKVDEVCDEITIDAHKLTYRKYIYLMLNKPSGYVSAVFDKRLPVVTSLVPAMYAHYEVFPVGRLDIDTEGLLILTNDGALTHRALSPKSHVNKTYYVETEKEMDISYIDTFKEGVTLDDGYKTMSADIKIDEDKKSCTLVIREGKFHQVKRMMEAMGNKVTYLKRIKMGTLSLDPSLKLGEIRELSEEEVIKLEEKENGYN